LRFVSCSAIKSRRQALLEQRRAMMTFGALTIFAIVVGTASIVIDRRWRARQSAADTPAEGASTTPLLSRMTERVAATLGSMPIMGGRLTRRKDANLPSQFQAWMARSGAEDPSLNQWVQGLSTEALEAFTDHVSAFCAEMGFELSWVVQQRLDAQPDLARAFEKVVLDYCRACREAAAAQGELEVYKTLQAFEANPSGRKTQAFGQKLFAKVVEAGLTSVSMPEYLMATPKEQQQHMVRAIREAAKAHGATFNRLLKEVARDPGLVSGAAQPAATSESAS
jgi:hypothetical protein